MSGAKPLPVAVAALFAVVRRHNLLDGDSLHRLRTRLVRDGVADLATLRRWLREGDVNPRVGKALAKLLPGRDDLRIGDCLVLAHLAEGGMGSVDLVEHDGQLRVCKTIKAGQQSGNAGKRFRREAAITATFDHAHVVRSFGHGEDGDRLYLVLEWVPGGDVQLLVEAGGPLQVPETLIILHQAALGLAHAHGRKLIHRDIKPANLFVSEAGTIRVADFGLARSTGDDASGMTVAGATVGTPSYMAPEQIQGQDLDGRADLYALGCVLHYCLTGHPPWSGAITDVLRGHLHLDPPHPGQRRNDVPAGLLALHGDLLAKEADRRPADAEALVRRTTDLLRTLGRDPNDGLSQRVVAQSTTRHPAPAVSTEPEETLTQATMPARPVDPSTTRLARRDVQPPADLAVALTALRLRLAIGDGGAVVATLLAGPEIGLGREADVVMGVGHDVGRIHCRLVRYDDTPALVDDGSANGTWLDGRWLPTGRPLALTLDREQQVRLGGSGAVALRAIAQRTAPVPGLEGGLGSGAGWDAVVMPALAMAWVHRRLLLGPDGSDLPLPRWSGSAIEVARWGGAWVWRHGDGPWLALAPGALGRTGLMAVG